MLGAAFYHHQVLPGLKFSSNLPISVLASNTWKQISEFQEATDKQDLHSTTNPVTDQQPSPDSRLVSATSAPVAPATLPETPSVPDDFVSRVAKSQRLQNARNFFTAPRQPTVKRRVLLDHR
jgi:hypothetical protein